MDYTVTLTFRRPGESFLLTRVVDVLGARDVTDASVRAAETLNTFEQIDGRQQPIIVGYYAKGDE